MTDATLKSDDVAQRIAARREQLEAKIRARRRGPHADVASDAGRGDVAMGKGESQVTASRRALTALKIEAEESITQFRLHTDGSENVRRHRDEGLRSMREKKTADEAASCTQRKGAVQFHFETLYRFHIPQELAAELAKQKEVCQRLIDAKDQLLAEYRSQMRDKEEEYVRDLKSQAEQIDRLLEEMHAQTRSMAQAYSRELHAIEEAYSQERRELLQQCSHEVGELMRTRTEREQELRKQRDLNVAEAQNVLDARYEDAAERFNRAKMEGQHDLHGLAQELEKCKADYLLNAERLNYNLQVLRERVKENKNAQNQHKRKLTRLQDVLSQLIVRYSESDKRFRQMNHDLTEGFRRVTAQYKELQGQFQHFEKADVERFDNIWAMHDRDCLALVRKCLQGDRVVFEEVLGMTWVPPPLDFWPARTAAPAVGDSTADASTAAAAPPEASAEATAEDDDVGDLSDAARGVLQLLYTQVPFIVEQRAREARDAMMAAVGGGSADTQGTAMLRKLMDALGLSASGELNDLMAICAPTDEEGRSVPIHPQDVVQALGVFLDQRKARETAAAAASGGGEGTVGATTSASAVDDAQNEQRRAEREYWSRVAGVIPPSHRRVWVCLEEALGKYLAQLQQRSVLIAETDALRLQNDELRGLLNEYLGSRVNEELYSPPKLQVVVQPPS